jgi:hypothetical protein
MLEFHERPLHDERLDKDWLLQTNLGIVSNSVFGWMESFRILGVLDDGNFK